MIGNLFRKFDWITKRFFCIFTLIVLYFTWKKTSALKVLPFGNINLIFLHAISIWYNILSFFIALVSLDLRAYKESVSRSKYQRAQSASTANLCHIIITAKLISFDIVSVCVYILATEYLPFAKMSGRFGPPGKDFR